MGRRAAVDAVVIAADSYQSSSAESSFREHDDVFLQTRTRIWLGEVLKIRLNEEIHISNLLADGELLFEVSKLIWNMLLEKCAELRHLKAYQHPIRPKKCNGRYMPYSNVDSFLKICKVLGLNSIDLFSPSDVVEKRDTRKVCICIRALSKKARSKQLNVPDFDVVCHVIAMPTDMVGCIRRSLELSQCSFSSSCSYNSLKDSRYKIQQKDTSECDENCDSSSDVSDEAESKYYGVETYRSFEKKFDNPATPNLDTEIPFDAFSAVKLHTKKEIVLQPELGKPHVSEFENGDPKSVFAWESFDSFSMHQNGRDSHNLSSSQVKSQGNLHYRNSRVNKDTRQYCGDTSELNDVDLTLRNDDSSVGESLFDNIAGRDFISDYLAFSDSVVFGADGSSPFLLDGEDNMCNFFMGIDSSTTNRENKLCPRSPDDMEDVEVSSTTSMSSILGRLLNMDFDEQFDVVDSSTIKVEPAAFLEARGQHRRLFMEDQVPEVAEFETLSHSSVTDVIEYQNEMRVGNSDFVTDFHSTCHNQGQPCNMGSQMHQKNTISEIHPVKYKFMEETQPGSSALSSGDISEPHQESISPNEKITGYSEHAIEDPRKHKTSDSLAENVLDRRKDPIGAHKKPLLKTFVGGTALVGTLFLLLHISRRGQVRNEVPSKQLNQNQKLKGSKSSVLKEQSSRPNGTSYPSEKLKFGK